MPDVFNEILQRLDALEAAVHGRASKYFNRKLAKAEVALREGRVPRSIDRDVEEGKFPPPDEVVNGRAYWWLSTLERHDRALRKKGLQTRRGPPREAGARRRKNDPGDAISATGER